MATSSSDSSYERTITHTASGASAKIHDFGATLMSYKAQTGRECLFVSRDAKLDGSKAVRGGVPLVFPQFGQPDKSMPQHGFLRVSFWTVDESSIYDKDESAGVTYTLQLKDVSKGRGGSWSADATTYDCKCMYHISINGTSFTTKLEIQNTGNVEFPFQTLLHTYYLVDNKSALDPTQCNVTGLQGYHVSDKVSKTEYIHESSDPITIQGETDRVYSPPPPPATVGSSDSTTKNDVNVVVAVGGGNKMKVTGTGTVDGTHVPVSCVVWNPHIDKAKAMSDFGDDQYSKMICVEPGLLNGETTLAPGKLAVLSVTSEVMPSSSL